MKTTTLILHAGRQLLRESRLGELRVLFAALLIAVTASSALGYFNARLQNAMLMRATEFLGADMQLRGSLPPSPEQLELAQTKGLKQANVVEFTSVITTEQALQLAAIKAADSAYPLRGELRSREQLDSEEQTSAGPHPGEAWAEARLFAALNLQPGDQIEVGDKRLQLTRILTHEPDRAGDFYSFNPRVLIHLDDLAATGVIQPGSRVTYRTLWSGAPEQIQALRQQLAAQLKPQQRIEDARAGNQQVSGGISRAERYLNLANLAVIILCGVAVALSANRFANRRFDSSALLRCLGLSRRQTLAFYASQLLILGCLAALLGVALGWLGQWGLLQLLADYLPADLPSAGVTPALSAIATGMTALIGFALPPLVALGRVPPIRVLRSDALPTPASSWAIYACALLALGLIIWHLSLDSRLTFALLGGGLVACLLLGSLLWLSLKTLQQLLAKAGLAWRLGLGQLLRRPIRAAGQALAFGLILLAMSLVALLRTELLNNWQAKLPANAPNHFALNILPDQQQNFAEHIEQFTGAPPHLYPVVPGRLIEINNQPVRRAVTKEGESSGDNALRRDLSLTWAAELPEGNQLTQGTWWSDATHTLPGVSVEAELAKRLGLKLGDQLLFNVGAVEVKVEIQSLRSVEWDSFQPNFYMVFQPGTLEQVPATYMTSFYLPSDRPDNLLALARTYPNVTLLEVEAILRQIRTIMVQVTLAIEYVLLFVLAAGLCVLLAGLQATLDERLRQGALLRALGAQRKLLRQARRNEFALLGATSGLLAAIGCELISYLLYSNLFNMAWSPHPWLLLLPVVGALLISLVGSLGTRRAITSSPLTILRN